MDEETTVEYTVVVADATGQVIFSEVVEMVFDPELTTREIAKTALQIAL